jgi:phosphonate transport system substrate-binding protein
LISKEFTMFKHIYLYLALLLSTTLVTLSFAAGAETKPVYHFSPVNQYGINLTAAYWNPIIAYVSEKSGVNLSLKIGRTSADTTSFVLAKEVEFAFTNHLFSPERQTLGWKVFGRRKTPPIYGQIIVPAESGLTSIAQLAGQAVAFPGPEALLSYKMPYAHLLSKGIEIQVVFGGNMDAALTQLFSGKVSAVGGNSQLIEGFSVREKKNYRVLWSTEAVYDLALMVSPNVSAATAKAVADAFMSMSVDPHGRAIIERVSKLVALPEDAHFLPSNGSEFGAYYHFFKTAPAKLH